MTQHYERALRGSRLRATQFSLLALLTQTGPLPMSGLAAKLGVERTTLTRNLRPLEAKGLVRTMTTGADQRVRRVGLTAAGRTRLTKALPGWRQAQASIAPILGRWKLENLLRSNE